jgi:mono/diheme cytochrome c family protein
VSVEEAVGGGWPNEEAMQHHQFAAYLMWLGVVLPSDPVFRAGAQQMEHVEKAPDVKPEVALLEQRVHDLAVEAAAATDEASRAAALGKYLHTCATCHTQTDAKIPR